MAVTLILPDGQAQVIEKDTVTTTVKPDKGYELDTLKVLDKDGDKVKITEKKGK